MALYRYFLHIEAWGRKIINLINDLSKFHPNDYCKMVYNSLSRAQLQAGRAVVIVGVDWWNLSKSIKELGLFKSKTYKSNVLELNPLLLLGKRE